MAPDNEKYDVVIIGGAMIGSAIAWFLISNEDFNGTICVIEKDLTFEFASTSRSNSCIRQQYSNDPDEKFFSYSEETLKNLFKMTLLQISYYRILVIYTFPVQKILKKF